MAFDDLRRVTDPRELRAMSHPVRLALMDALRDEGPLTATQAAELVGESPANCSFHLRTLAKYGFVQEAEGGKGRERPWRLVAVAHVVPDAGELAGEAGAAAGALVEVLAERDFERIRNWLHSSTQYPEVWRQASFDYSVRLQMTPEELAGVGEAIHRLLVGFLGRSGNHRPEGAVPVSITTLGFPTRIPSSEKRN